MPWFRGDNCDDEVNKSASKGCTKCYPSKAGSPIVVKITKPVPTRNYGNRFGPKGGDCCSRCIHRGNANQMVYNQNNILNFDRINRINDARAANNANLPNITFTPGDPTAKPEKRKCDNCLKILREKELELLKKEQEILKIKTHFTTLGKTGQESGLGTNCEHCFKALREKEFELFKKEQEIAKMKMAAAKSPIDTKAKVDKAKCANCFKALRQKELELIKKEHALMKNMTRPNINVKNFNYCSCCRDNKKSAINKAKQDEETRKKNRDNCFKAIRMKEIRLLEKEKELEKKIQRFREESLAKAKKDLDKVPDPRLIVQQDKVIKCVCSCKGPTGTADTVKPAARTCKASCCFMKLANNFLCYLLRPATVNKETRLPCSFMKLLPWTRPGNLEARPYKCCTILGSRPAGAPPKMSNKQLKEKEKWAKKYKGKDGLAAVRAAKDIPKVDEDYRVKAIGQIKPGKRRRSMFKARKDVAGAEVRREYGASGLEVYKERMKELPTTFTQVSPHKITKNGITKAPKGFGEDTTAKESTGSKTKSVEESTPKSTRGFGANAVQKMKYKNSETAMPIKVKSKASETFESKMSDEETEPRKKMKAIGDFGGMYKKIRAKVKDEPYEGPKISKSDENNPRKYRTENEEDDYEGLKTSRSVYDDQTDWVMSGSTEKVERPVSWLPERPPCPAILNKLGHVLLYLTGCFIGIPCGLFLCLCFLCTSCSD